MFSVREYAESRGFEVVGKLKRLPDGYYGLDGKHDPVWADEAGNEYWGNNKEGYCIITTDGGVI